MPGTLPGYRVNSLKYINFSVQIQIARCGCVWCTQHTQGKVVHTCMYLGRVDLCKKYCCCFLSGYPRYFCCFFRLPGCTHDTPGEHTRTQLLLGRRHSNSKLRASIFSTYTLHTHGKNIVAPHIVIYVY